MHSSVRSSNVRLETNTWTTATAPASRCRTNATSTKFGTPLSTAVSALVSATTATSSTSLRVDANVPHRTTAAMPRTGTIVTVVASALTTFLLVNSAVKFGIRRDAPANASPPCVLLASTLTSQPACALKTLTHVAPARSGTRCWTSVLPSGTPRHAIHVKGSTSTLL